MTFRPSQPGKMVWHVADMSATSRARRIRRTWRLAREDESELIDEIMQQKDPHECGTTSSAGDAFSNVHFGVMSISTKKRKKAQESQMDKTMCSIQSYLTATSYEDAACVGHVHEDVTRMLRGNCSHGI